MAAYVELDELWEHEDVAQKSQTVIEAAFDWWRSVQDNIEERVANNLDDDEDLEDFLDGATGDALYDIGSDDLFEELDKIFRSEDG